MKLVVAGLVVMTSMSTAYSGTDSTIVEYLRAHSQTPTGYVLSKATSHRITLIGEGHWLKHDVALVAGLIPALQQAGIDLALEVFPASEQANIDELVTMPDWNDQVANAIVRAAAWPYQEYRNLLRAAWSANQGADRHIRILGLGPPQDWRDVLLPKGITYDEFMADLVTKHSRQTRRRVVVYCGMHHAFTRYYQAELDNSGVAMAYMDRMGNILLRQFGEQVFVIALHKPMWCGSPAKPSYCLPFGGQIDCAAASLGGPLGFDIVGSPLAELHFGPDDYYGYGHSALRFVDYTDGYIWSGPVTSFQSVSIIPLSEYAPGEEAMAQVAHENPFNGEEDVSVQRLQEIWAEEIEASRDILAQRRWKHLADWEVRCKP